MHFTGTRLRRLSMLVAALSLAGSASVLAGTSPSSAFTVVAPEVPDPDGIVSVQTPMIRAVGETRDNAQLQVPEVTAWHMDGDEGSEGDQQVVAHYRLQRHDGNVIVDGEVVPVWTTVDSAQDLARVAPGGNVVLPGRSFARPSTSMTEEYRIQVVVSWLDLSTSFLLGSTTIVPSQWGDAVCATDPGGVACEPTMTGGLSF